MELIIDTYGTRINIKNRMLVVSPPDVEPIYVAFHEFNKLILHKGLRITSDVFYRLLKENIDIIFLTRNGTVKGRVWNNRFGSIADIREKQLALKNHPIISSWLVSIIQTKIGGHKNILYTLSKERDTSKNLLHETIRQLGGFQEEMEDYREYPTNEIINQLRSKEAHAARLYWKAIATVLLSDFNFSGRKPRESPDPFNAMLNYAYGMLYRKVESALLKVGIDPSIGWMHVNQFNKPSLVYDVIESVRFWADEVVIKIARNNIIPAALFDKKEGKSRMSKTARKLLALTMNDFLDNTINYKGKKQKREYFIFLHAQDLANFIKIKGEEIER